MIVVWGVAVGGEHHDVVPRGTQALYETLKSVLHAAHVAEGAGLLRARRQEEHCCTAWKRPQERTMQRWGGCILARSKEGWRRSTPAFLQVEVDFQVSHTCAACCVADCRSRAARPAVTQGLLAPLDQHSCCQICGSGDDIP